MKQAIGETKVLKSWKAAAAILNSDKGWKVFVYFILFYCVLFCFVLLLVCGQIFKHSVIEYTKKVGK